MNFRLVTACMVLMVGVNFALGAPDVASAPVAPTESQSASDGSETWGNVGEPDSVHEDHGRATVDQAREFLNNGDARRARNLLDQWLEVHELETGPWVPEALLTRGDALVALTYEYTALYDFEAIARRFPQSEAFPKAVERELEIAIRYANGLKRRWLGMRLMDASDVAIELLIRVQERMPGTTLSERAAIELADYYYDHRDIKLAGEAYSLYIENHPRGPNRIKAEERRIFCDIARFKGPEYDASGLIDAQVRIRDFQRRYRAEAEAAGLTEGLVARLDESRAAQLLEASDWYLKKDDEASARLLLRRLAREHPSTQAGSQAIATLEARGWFEEAPPTAKPENATGVTIEGPQIAKPVSPPTNDGADK